MLFACRQGAVRQSHAMESAGDCHATAFPGGCSMRRLKRVLLVISQLHGPGRSLDPGYARSNHVNLLHGIVAMMYKPGTP